MKVEVKVIFDIDTTNWFDDQYGKDWFTKTILPPNNSTTIQLWSNEVGDEIVSTSNYKIKILEP